MPEHLSCDGYPVVVGARFWNNNLRAVQVTRVATMTDPYGSTGEVQTWHDTTGGMSDTLSGAMRPYGRLVRFWDGRDAETVSS